MTDEYIEKFNRARAWLFLNGYLTEGENRKVAQRFEKEAKKQGTELITKSICSG